MAKSEFTQRLVTQYAKYRALKCLLDKWLEEKRGVIFQALQAGKACPCRGPFLLELGESTRRLNWKDEFQHWLANEGYAQDKVAGIVAAIEARPREKDPRIDCKANPNYRRPFPIKLPA